MDEDEIGPPDGPELDEEVNPEPSDWQESDESDWEESDSDWDGQPDEMQEWHDFDPDC